MPLGPLWVPCAAPGEPGSTRAGRRGEALQHPTAKQIRQNQACTQPPAPSFIRDQENTPNPKLSWDREFYSFVPCSYPKLTKVPASKSPAGPTPALGSGTGSAGTVRMGSPSHLPRDPSPSLALRRPAVFRASRLFLGISPACNLGLGGEPGAGGSSHSPPPPTHPPLNKRLPAGRARGLLAANRALAVWPLPMLQVTSREPETSPSAGWGRGGRGRGAGRKSQRWGGSFPGSEQKPSRNEAAAMLRHGVAPWSPSTGSR